MLNASNAVTFGKNLPTSPHLTAIENSCVECHMAPGHVDENDNVILVGSHSFRVTDPEGNDNVAICEECHGDVGESFDVKKFFVNGNADHDNDGVAEGLQDEVHGLMDMLAGMLPAAEGHDAYDPHDDPDSTWTKTELKAAFNYDYVYYDHSYGIHNPAYTVALLKVSIQALVNNAVEGDIVAIEDVPNDQGKQVRVIWDKFVDDGVAPDPIERYFVKRLDGENDWTGVGLYPAHGAARYALVVPTLFDSTAEGSGITTFKVVAVSRSGMVYESLAADGFSIDNLVPHAPSNLMAMSAGGSVELTWEAPADPDVNYYKIYRSTEASFIPDESTKISSTIDLNFMDVQPGIGDWYYIVVAVDFSGNHGNPSPPVNATITSVDGESAVPTEYDLSQNYPNPFNPETTISFSLRNAGHVTLDVYNAVGQKVVSLVDKDMSTGNYRINFVADGLSTGVYVYRIKVTSSEDNSIAFQSMRKMVLMK